MSCDERWRIIAEYSRGYLIITFFEIRMIRRRITGLILGPIAISFLVNPHCNANAAELRSGKQESRIVAAQAI